MLRSIKDLEDFSVGATDGTIGQVKDFYFDDDAWVIRYLVVDTGSWLSSRKVLISPIAIHRSIQETDWAARILPVALTKDQVRNSPDLDTDKPVSRQHEQQHLSYYGYPYYWGGGGMWGGGMYPFAMLPGYAGYGSASAEREAEAEVYAREDRARRIDGDAHLRSAKAVFGYHIHAIDGEIGHIDGLLVDAATWAIRYVVVDTSNWRLGHKVLIAPQWINGVHWSDSTVSVDLLREAVKSAPAFDPSALPDRGLESELYRHHGRAGYWSRGQAPGIER